MRFVGHKVVSAEASTNPVTILLGENWYDAKVVLLPALCVFVHCIACILI